MFQRAGQKKVALPKELSIYMCSIDGSTCCSFCVIKPVQNGYELWAYVIRQSGELRDAQNAVFPAAFMEEFLQENPFCVPKKYWNLAYSLFVAPFVTDEILRKNFEAKNVMSKILKLCKFKEIAIPPLNFQRLEPSDFETDYKKIDKLLKSIKNGDSWFLEDFNLEKYNIEVRPDDLDEYVKKYAPVLHEIPYFVHIFSVMTKKMIWFCRIMGLHEQKRLFALCNYYVEDVAWTDKNPFISWYLRTSVLKNSVKKNFNPMIAEQRERDDVMNIQLRQQIFCGILEQTMDVEEEKKTVTFNATCEALETLQWAWRPDDIRISNLEWETMVSEAIPVFVNDLITFWKRFKPKENTEEEIAIIISINDFDLTQNLGPVLENFGKSEDDITYLCNYYNEKLKFLLRDMEKFLSELPKSPEEFANNEFMNENFKKALREANKEYSNNWDRIHGAWEKTPLTKLHTLITPYSITQHLFSPLIFREKDSIFENIENTGFYEINKEEKTIILREDHFHDSTWMDEDFSDFSEGVQSLHCFFRSYVLLTLLTLETPLQKMEKRREKIKTKQCANENCKTPMKKILTMGLKSCSRCKNVKYCGKKCQTTHWKIHKKSCTPVETNI